MFEEETSFELQKCWLKHYFIWFQKKMVGKYVRREVNWLISFFYYSSVYEKNNGSFPYNARAFTGRLKDFWFNWLISEETLSPLK